MTKIALALGGNIGDVERCFKSAIAKLAENGVCDIRKSSFIKTTPEDCIPNTPPFINGAITGSWNKSLQDLFHLCQKIEEDLGRPNNHNKGQSRTIDIDIILFGDLIYKDNILEIPHKEAKNRFFVLFPLSEIAKEWIFPGSGVTVNELLKNFLNQKIGVIENEKMFTRNFGICIDFHNGNSLTRSCNTKNQKESF